MPHSLILGITECGKTTLGRDLSAEYKRAGVGVLVLDPLRDPRWHCDFITADADEFLDRVWRSKSCMLFIDEAGDAVGRYDVAMQKLATRARHWGHSTHFLTQRGAQLSPTVRNQCRYLFLFTSGIDDGEILAREFNQPMLAQCNQLPQFQYFFTSRFGTIQRKRVFTGDLDDSSFDRSRSGNSSIRPDPEPVEEKGNGREIDASGRKTGASDRKHGAGDGASGKAESRVDSMPD